MERWRTVCVTLAVIGEVKNVSLGRRRVRGRCHSFAGCSLRHIRALDPKGDTMPEGPLDFWEKPHVQRDDHVGICSVRMLCGVCAPPKASGRGEKQAPVAEMAGIDGNHRRPDLGHGDPGT
jgi:hypothetical protein